MAEQAGRALPDPDTIRAPMDFSIEEGSKKDELILSPLVAQMTNCQTTPRRGLPLPKEEPPSSTLNLTEVKKDSSSYSNPQQHPKHIPKELWIGESVSERESGFPKSSREQQSPKTTIMTPIQLPRYKTDEISIQGWMAKLEHATLRRKWRDHYFTLQGTRLAIHKDAHTLETCEYIDVRDYKVVCWSPASGLNSNAAFKTMISSRSGDKKDRMAFTFRLDPVVISTWRNRLTDVKQVRKGKDARAKHETHYFAAQSCNARDDWMRKLMLVEVYKNESEGYEVHLNGNITHTD